MAKQKKKKTYAKESEEIGEKIGLFLKKGYDKTKDIGKILQDEGADSIKSFIKGIKKGIK